MTLVQLIPLALQVSLGLVVVSIALRASDDDWIYLVRRPGLLLRSILSMNVITPLVAVAIVVILELRHEVAVALILLAVAPVPPILPAKENKAGGNVSYGIGLLAISALLSIGVAPASVWLIGRLFGRVVEVPAGPIAATVAMSVLGPLIVGATMRRLAPSTVRMARAIANLSTVVLVLAFVVVLVASWRAIVATIGDFTVLAIVLFVVVSLAVGHLLGGPDHDTRTVLALSTASRHPGVAIAIAGATVQDKAAVSAAVLLAFLVSAVATAPYAKWRARGHRPAAAPTS